VIEDCDFPDLEALTIIGKLYADRLIIESKQEPRLPGEPRAAVRLERWLSEPTHAAPHAEPYHSPYEPSTDGDETREVEPLESRSEARPRRAGNRRPRRRPSPALPAAVTSFPSRP
jgi:hypothetical protein